MISKSDIHIIGERSRILLQADEFICLLPHPALRGYISNYNITFPTQELFPNSFTEMPCGCASLTVGKNSRAFFVTLEGPTTKPSIVAPQTNRMEMLVTIEFKPAGLYVLTGVDQWELIDQTLDFEAVDAPLSKLLCEVVEKSESVGALATDLDTLLLEQMSASCHPQFIPALQEMIDCFGHITVKELSNYIHYSQRQMNRMFKQHVGIGAKSFSRLIRINNAFHLLQKPGNSLTWVSDVTGFHDLSHFIRDFRSVCGITPQEYRNNLSDFYSNPKRF